MAIRQNEIRKVIADHVGISQVKLAWSLLFAVMVAVLYFGAVGFLDATYPNPVHPDDLVLDILPEMRLFIAIGEIVSAAQGLLTVYGLARNRFQDLPRFIFQLGLMFALRSVAIVLTPLAQIQNPAENFSPDHWIAQSMYKGMFFSGHTGSAFTQFFFEKQRQLRRIHLVLACMQMFSLLASHSHYSIDIFAAFFVAYFVTHLEFKRLVPADWRDISWAPWS